MPVDYGALKSEVAFVICFSGYIVQRFFWPRHGGGQMETCISWQPMFHVVTGVSKEIQWLIRIILIEYFLVVKAFCHCTNDWSSIHTILSSFKQSLYIFKVVGEEQERDWMLFCSLTSPCGMFNVLTDLCNSSSLDWMWASTLWQLRGYFTVGVKLVCALLDGKMICEYTSAVKGRHQDPLRWCPCSQSGAILANPLSGEAISKLSYELIGHSTLFPTLVVAYENK